MNIPTMMSLDELRRRRKEEPGGASEEHSEITNFAHLKGYTYLCEKMIFAEDLLVTGTTKEHNIQALAAMRRVLDSMTKKWVKMAGMDDVRVMSYAPAGKQDDEINMFYRILALENSGAIPKTSADHLHKIRKVGNDANHEDDEDEDAWLAQAPQSTVRRIAEQVYAFLYEETYRFVHEPVSMSYEAYAGWHGAGTDPEHVEGSATTVRSAGASTGSATGAFAAHEPADWRANGMFTVSPDAASRPEFFYDMNKMRNIRKHAYSSRWFYVVYKLVLYMIHIGSFLLICHAVFPLGARYQFSDASVIGISTFLVLVGVILTLPLHLKYEEDGACNIGPQIFIVKISPMTFKAELDMKTIPMLPVTSPLYRKLPIKNTHQWHTTLSTGHQLAVAFADRFEQDEYDMFFYVWIDGVPVIENNRIYQERITQALAAPPRTAFGVQY